MNFSMMGALVNCGAVIVGTLIGMLFKKGIPQRISGTLMYGMGLSVIYIGISGMLGSAGEDGAKPMLVMIFSVLAGSAVGELIDLDKLITELGNSIEKKIGRRHGNVAEGFVTATLLFCVGAMSILGPLESGLKGDHTIQLTKSVLDFVSSVIYASSLGIGVIFASLSVLALQGSLTLLAELVAPILTDGAIASMTVVGSLLIVGLALNILGVTKLKIMNFLPAVFLAVPINWLYDVIVNAFS